MIRLVVWILWVFILLIISFLVSPQNIMTPEFLFFIGFFAQAVYAVFYVDLWNLDFSNLTMSVLFVGAFTFFAVSVLTKAFYSKYRFVLTSPRSGSKTEHIRCVSEEIILSRWKLIVILLFMIIVLIWKYFVLRTFNGESIMENILSFRLASRVDDIPNYPYFLELSEVFCTSTGYYLGYVLAHQLVLKYRRFRGLLIINLLVVMVDLISCGGRGGPINQILLIFVEAYFIYGRINSWEKKIPVKTILKVFLIVIVVVLTFQTMGTFLGRGSVQSLAEYIGVYLSAELKNLDIAVREGKFGTDWKTCYTLCNPVSVVGKVFGMPELVHSYRCPFRDINGHSLGNVATTFFPYVKDGGIVGVIFFTAIMAYVCQRVYLSARKSNKRRPVDYSVLIYTFIVCSIVFSFFSDKFYGDVINSVCLKYILSWAILNFYFFKIRA